jgi:hypothetical protein
MVVIPRSLKRFSLADPFFKGRPHGTVTVSSTFSGEGGNKKPGGAGLNV